MYVEQKNLDIKKIMDIIKDERERELSLWQPLKRRWLATCSWNKFIWMNYRHLSLRRERRFFLFFLTSANIFFKEKKISHNRKTISKIVLMSVKIISRHLLFFRSLRATTLFRNCHPLSYQIFLFKKIKSKINLYMPNKK